MKLWEAMVEFGPEQWTTSCVILLRPPKPPLYCVIGIAGKRAGLKDEDLHSVINGHGLTPTLARYKDDEDSNYYVALQRLLAEAFPIFKADTSMSDIIALNDRRDAYLETDFWTAVARIKHFEETGDYDTALEIGTPYEVSA